MATSAELFKQAQELIPGGVNSPVRAFDAVGGTPVYIERGDGCRMHSADGREYIDFCGSWGPLVLGHAHPRVVAAVRQAAGGGLSFGANTPREVEFAALLQQQVPHLERLRLVNSGTEATMTALRVARGATGRQRYIKFEGCYHGHSDFFLVAAGSGLLTSGTTSSAGVPDSVGAEVFIAPYNDLEVVRQLVEEHGQELAAIILEPVAGNMGLTPPVAGFVEGLRQLCDQCGALLILDEVISGFRLGPTTWAQRQGIRPDLTCLGKIIGGGMPIGALGGRREIMEHLAPLGKVYQAGTLSGNPIAVAAGLATVQTLIEEDPYPEIERLATKLQEGLTKIAAGSSTTFHCQRLGGMFTVFFGEGPVCDLNDAKACDTERFAEYFTAMLAKGIYLPPSQFEVAFVSAAHTEAEIDAYLEAASEVLG